MVAVRYPRCPRVRWRVAAAGLLLYAVGPIPSAQAGEPLLAQAAPPQGGRGAGVDALRRQLAEIEGLADKDPKTALPRLLQALQDPNPVVRAVAVRVLGVLGDAGAIEALGRALTGDRDAGVREVAAEALGEIGETGKAAVIPILVQGLKDQSVDVRETVVDALDRIPGPQAEAALDQALKDEDEDVREAAAEALARRRQAQPRPTPPRGK